MFTFLIELKIESNSNNNNNTDAVIANVSLIHAIASIEKAAMNS